MTLNGTWQVDKKLQFAPPAALISRSLEPRASHKRLDKSSKRTMSGLNRSYNLLKGVMRHHIIPKANITAKPPKHVLTIGEQVIGMTVMFVTILGPSGWILAHLEDYKNRPGSA